MVQFKGVKKMVLLANLTAVAIVLGLVESLYEISAVPGAKLGLANLVVLVVLFMFSWKEAYIVSITRVVMIGILSGRFEVTFWMGFGGAVLSVGVMSLVKLLKVGVTLTSLLGSVSHQIGQMVIAFFFFPNVEIASFLVIMAPLGIVTGVVIGIITERFLTHFIEKDRDDEKELQS